MSDIEPSVQELTVNPLEGILRDVRHTAKHDAHEMVALRQQLHLKAAEVAELKATVATSGQINHSSARDNAALQTKVAALKAEVTQYQRSIEVTQYQRSNEVQRVQRVQSVGSKERLHVASTAPFHQRMLALRKTPSWPRSWANCSLVPLYSHMNAWANLHVWANLTSFSRGTEDTLRRSDARDAEATAGGARSHCRFALLLTDGLAPEHAATMKAQAAELARLDSDWDRARRDRDRKFAAIGLQQGPSGRPALSRPKPKRDRSGAAQTGPAAVGPLPIAPLNKRLV